MKPLFSATLLVAVLANPATAVTIADIDLNSLTFDVDTLADNPVVTGDSNGSGFTFTAVSNFFAPFSNNSQSQAYNDLPNSYDDIHAGADFSIVFDAPVKTLLVALANDNNTLDGPDFGVAPTEVIDINQVGTLLSITDINGALALFDFSTAVTTLNHVNNNGVTDGWDLSFFVIETADPAPIPVPAGLPLLAASLAMFLPLRRRKNKTSYDLGVFRSVAYGIH